MLALSQALQKEQLLLTAMEWQKFLEPEIPADFLDKVFGEAVKRHTISRAVNATDLLTVWRDIKPPPNRKTARDYHREIEGMH